MAHGPSGFRITPVAGHPRAESDPESWLYRASSLPRSLARSTSSCGPAESSGCPGHGRGLANENTSLMGSAPGMWMGLVDHTLDIHGRILSTPNRSHHQTAVQMLRSLSYASEVTCFIQGLVRRLGSSAGIPSSSNLAWSGRSLETTAFSSLIGIHMSPGIMVLCQNTPQAVTTSACQDPSYRMISSSSCSGHDERVRPGREEVAMNKDKLK